MIMDNSFFSAFTIMLKREKRHKLDEYLVLVYHFFHSSRNDCRVAVPQIIAINCTDKHGEASLSA